MFLWGQYFLGNKHLLFLRKYIIPNSWPVEFALKSCNFLRCHEYHHLCVFVEFRQYFVVSWTTDKEKSEPGFTHQSSDSLINLTWLRVHVLRWTILGFSHQMGVESRRSPRCIERKCVGSPLWWNRKQTVIHLGSSSFVALMWGLFLIFLSWLF